MIKNSNVRIIARLDIKGDKLVKSVQLEGVQVIGDPSEYASRYYRQGIDELLLVDAVASLYRRQYLAELIRNVAAHAFVPITVGGGIRSLDDVDSVLRSGADKVTINSAAVKRPKLITEVANRFGSQCMVAQIDAKCTGQGKWEAYIDGGREPTGLDVIDWVQRVHELGAGEILLTSVDFEGTRQGLDLELCKTVSAAVTLPMIACGGVGSPDDIYFGVIDGASDAVAVSDLLHIQGWSVASIKNRCHELGLAVRRL